MNLEVNTIDCSKSNDICCRLIITSISKFHRGDCVCVHLTDDNKCEIYEDRPFICNTVRIYNKYYKDKYTIEEWNELNNKACEALRNEQEQSESKDKVQK